MDNKLAAKLNEQVKNELYSAYLYLAMAAYFESENWQGFARWMKMQAKEETEHAMKIFDYLCDRGERVVLEAIEKPPVEFASAVEAFEKTLEHEKKVTAMIDGLYKTAQDCNDNATQVFLSWFIQEQVEEEKNAADILDKLQKIKPDSGAMFMLDKVLGERG